MEDSKNFSCDADVNFGPLQIGGPMPEYMKNFLDAWCKKYHPEIDEEIEAIINKNNNKNNG